MYFLNERKDCHIVWGALIIMPANAPGTYWGKKTDRALMLCHTSFTQTAALLRKECKRFLVYRKPMRFPVNRNK